jgi:hypothetical protein
MLMPQVLTPCLEFFRALADRLPQADQRVAKAVRVEKGLPAVANASRKCGEWPRRCSCRACRLPFRALPGAHHAAARNQISDYAAAEAPPSTARALASITPLRECAGFVRVSRPTGFRVLNAAAS